MVRPSMSGLSLLRAAMLGTTALVLLGPGTALARVGVTSATDGDPRGKPPEQPERVLRIGIDVQANEAITTGPNDRAHLVFLDGTSLTVGPDAQLSIDKFVYDPNTKTGELAVNASKGVLRLVGGKISKTNDITVTTPSSTIGIRGGAVVMDVQRVRTVTTKVYGDRVDVHAGGHTQRMTRNGSQITSNVGTPPSAPVMAPKGALSGQMAQLEGNNSGSGGGNSSGGGNQGGNNPAGGGGNQGSNSANNSQSADQGAKNFSQSSGQAAPPPPAPPPIITTNGGGPVSNQTNNAVNGAVNNVQQQQFHQKAEQQQTTTAPTTTVIVSRGRFLGVSPYTAFNGGNLSVTPTPANNTTLAPTATVTNGNTIAIGISDGRSIVLPWQMNTLASGFSIGTFNDPNLGQISGRGFVSATGDYFAYVFTDSNNKKLGFFGGSPTPQSAIPTSGIGAYNVTNTGDPNRLPWADATVGDNASLKAAASISKLYTAYSANNAVVVGQPELTPARTTQMQATISIAGQGAAQVSYSALYLGTIFQDSTYSNSSFAAGSFNGIYRTSSSGFLGRLVSSEGTADTGSGNAIYGTNGPAVMVFVPDNLGATTTNSGGFVTGVTGSRTPSASLNSSPGGTPQIDYLAPNVATSTSTPAGVGVSRTSQTLNGFAGGIVEGSSGSRVFGTTSTVTDLTLTTDASSNRAQVLATVSDWNTTANATANFKLGNLTGLSSSTSTFIDDNTYGVRDRLGSSFTDTTSIALGNNTASTTGVTPQDFMVSYNAAPQPALFSGANNGAGVTPCTCEFLTWGWWSGQLGYGNSSALTPNTIDRWGLATYVAGTPSTTAALSAANTASSTATYTGHMVGNVLNGSNSYIAAGSYNNTWSFGSQTGVVTATFDNSSFTGTTALTASGPGFTGSGASSNNGTKSLSLNGAFFSAPGAPLKYQAGTFGITGTNSTSGTYKAGGTFAAQTP